MKVVREESDARPASEGCVPCIVVVFRLDSEVDHVADLLSSNGTGRLVTYRKIEDLALNAPRGPVALFVLADDSRPATTRRSLAWAKRRWPTCPSMVVGNPGDRELEMAARSCGASYFVRPVGRLEWAAVVEHGLARAAKAGQERWSITRRPV